MTPSEPNQNQQKTPTNNTSALDTAVYKTLLESTKAIPWKLDWKTMKFAYIGPQIEQLLGWTPASWATAEDWATRMHPDDGKWVVEYCISQSKAGIDHEADYRALTKDGSYVWIRDVVHVARDADGNVESLIGFMFDISERKNTEHKLIHLQKELEALSFKDSLTNVANRRRFDAVLDMEWRHAKRNNQPLSLIMIDIDFFKRYNDHYGHIQGDACLKRVAHILNATANRARDSFARYGGEEFAYILPETDAVSAMNMAERCSQLIEKAKIPHADSPLGGILTLSMGVGTITPSRNDDPIAFINVVDRKLYEAKQSGRNRIV